MNTIYDGSFVLGNTNELTFSAGPGIKVDQPSEGVVRIGNDETVLWESSAGYTPGNGKSVTDMNLTLSENISAFNSIKIFMEGRMGSVVEIPTSKVQTYITVPDMEDNTFICGLLINSLSADPNKLRFRCGYSTNAYAAAYRQNADYGYFTLKKIVGINRKEV